MSFILQVGGVAAWQEKAWQCSYLNFTQGIHDMAMGVLEFPLRSKTALTCIELKVGLDKLQEALEGIVRGLVGGPSMQLRRFVLAPSVCRMQSAGAQCTG
jgi:hypothetical protein